MTNISGTDLHFFAVYDLRVLPATFDIANFLTIARSRAKRINQKSSITPIIITGRLIRRPDFKATSQREEISRRIERIILPICQMIESINQPIVIDESLFGKISRSLTSPESIVFPDDYNFESPALYKYYKNRMIIPETKKSDLRCILNRESDMQAAHTYLSRFDAKKDFVVFAERKNIHSGDKSRNSANAWTKRVLELLVNKYRIMYIPDYLSRTIISHPNIKTLREPSHDLRLRSCIYELAKFCILPAGGLTTVAYLNKKTKYIKCGFAAGEYFNEQFYLKEGFEKNKNPYNPNSLSQVWAWSMPEPEYIEKLVARHFGN